MRLVEKLMAEWEENGRRWEKCAKKIRALGFLVWNPALYGLDAYSKFLRKFPPKSGAILALGLNPGPYGMAQTGIPFTDCRTATGKLGIEMEIPGIAPPDLADKFRKPDGRWKGTYERSSLVVYRFLEKAWKGSLQRAFENFYIGNPCPLFMLEPGGWNVTPAHRKLKSLKELAELRKLAVIKIHEILKPRGIVFLGADVAEAVGDTAEALVSQVIRHPHPARSIPDQWGEELTLELKRRKLL